MDDRWQCLSGLHWKRMEDVDAEIDTALDDIDHATWIISQTDDAAERDAWVALRESAERRLHFWLAVQRP